jgi:glutamate---cysteine ligase / carboxylate-amine ligase
MLPPSPVPEGPIPFRGSPRPTIGIELELQIIDPETMNLTSGALKILERTPENGRIKQELTQSTIEVLTGIHDTVAEAREDLRGTLALLSSICDDLGLGLAAAGTHPFAQWREQDIFPNDRYEDLVERIQWPARRLLIYGLHVHVGVNDGDEAIAVSNALTSYIPHLLALSASSPFVDFEHTGLASTRAKIFEGMPTAGLPSRLEDYAEFQTFTNTLIKAGAIESVREIWWDIRPHPYFGTLEVRVCDVPSTLNEAASLAALIQCLVVWLGTHYRQGGDLGVLPDWIVRENKWRACRHGLDADIITDSNGTRSSLRAEIPLLLERLLPTAAALGCSDEIRGVSDILEGGASYERQRRTYADTELLTKIVDSLAAELRASITSPELATRAS